MSEDLEQVKICRNCHTVYKNISQKFCGNGCKLKFPFFIDGKVNHDVISREVLMPKTSPLLIRWVCNNCKREYSSEELNSRNYVCECGIENDFYPFTTKECSEPDCIQEKNHHHLPLEAKVCDLCGQSEFIYNGTMKRSELKPSTISTKVCWEEPFQFESFQQKESTKSDTSLLSCKFSILNNNVEYLLYGQDLSVSTKDLIKNAKAYVPDEIYEQLIQKYSLDKPVFSIRYNSQTQSFTLFSVFENSVSELDARYFPQNQHIFHPNQLIPLKENVLTQIRSGFFKIHIWVY
ncbi:MAG: hypothetical protein DRO88_03735 [Promethearchaeia archaeon]|nr:MAG: hypothetical protein DRO88_03735 [Candidatus Lokiarchaeia archaeon]